MNQNQAYLQQAQRFVLVQWVFFNALGWSLGLLLTVGADEASPPHVRFGIIAFMLGIGQWIVVRRYLRGLRFLWIFATSAGFVLGQLASQRLANYVVPLVGNELNGTVQGIVFGGAIGITLGAIVGLLQAILLPRRYAPVRYWVLANIVGWGIGFQLASLSAGVGYQLTSLLTTIVSSLITGLWVMQLVSKAD